MEIWKDIDGFQGYQVSNKGRVRTHNKVTRSARFEHREWKDRIMKPKISKKDRMSRLELWSEGKHKTVLVHRLVASAFLPPPKPNETTVNHKDGNRLNNCVENLEWLSNADNIRHGFINDFYPQKHCTLIDDDGNHYDFRSLSMASRFLGKTNGYVSGAIKNHCRIYDKNKNVYQIVLKE